VLLFPLLRNGLLLSVWSLISNEIVQNSFLKCEIFNSSDGMEDNALFELDSESSSDENDSESFCSDNEKA